MMQEAKFNNLCSHYKDSFDIHRETIKQRDMLFYVLLVILAMFAMQLSAADTVTKIINELISHLTGAELGKDLNLISTLMWLFLLAFSTRYFQVVIEIERQYNYLHTLELDLNQYYSGSKVFTREGKEYLRKYPLFSNWTWFLYTLFFPLLIFLSIISRIKLEIYRMDAIGFNQVVFFACYLMIGTSVILYVYRLHESNVNKIFKILKL